MDDIMTDYGWKWNRGQHQTAAVAESDERRADRLAIERLKIEQAVACEQLRSLKEKTRENKDYREQLRGLAWANSGHPVFARDCEHGQELDVSTIPQGWPEGVDETAFLNEQFSKFGWADDA